MRVTDLWFETRPGAWKVKMATFFTMDVKVVNLASGKMLWRGRADAGAFHAKGAAMGREATDKRLNADFRALMEAVLRSNSELQSKLAGLRQQEPPPIASGS